MAIQPTALEPSAVSASAIKKTASSVRSDEIAASAKISADVAARKLLLAKRLQTKLTAEYATEQQAAATGKVPGESLGSKFTAKA